MDLVPDVSNPFERPVDQGGGLGNNNRNAQFTLRNAAAIYAKIKTRRTNDTPQHSTHAPTHAQSNHRIIKYTRRMETVCT